MFVSMCIKINYMFGIEICICRNVLGMYIVNKYFFCDLGIIVIWYLFYNFVIEKI